MSFGLTGEHQRDLLTKASRDEGFATRLQEQPKATIAETLGVSIPDGMEVRVVRDTASVSHTVIPAEPVDIGEAERRFQAQLSETEADAQTRSVRIIAKAQQDGSFRSELQQNPRGVLERELDVTMPEGIDFRVLQDNEDTYHVVLPPPQADDVEISDEELEAVAGGSSPTVTVPIIVSSVIASAITVAGAKGGGRGGATRRGGR